jgi:PilZ domain
MAFLDQPGAHSAGNVHTEAARRERRAAERHVSVFLTAKIISGDRQAIGRVVNLSRHGARIETQLRLVHGQPLTIELRSDLAAQGIVRWLQDGAAGVEFNTPVDIDRYFMRVGRRVDRIKPRAPRYSCFAAGMVSLDGACAACHVLDISLLGARLSRVMSLKPGQTVLVEIAGLDSRRAEIVWTSNEEMGVVFQRSHDFRMLDAWLRASSVPPPPSRDDQLRFADDPGDLWS